MCNFAQRSEAFTGGPIKAGLVGNSKNMNEQYNQIGKRNCSLTDQLDFAEFSGDNNPMYIDPLEA